MYNEYCVGEAKYLIEHFWNSEEVKVIDEYLQKLPKEVIIQAAHMAQIDVRFRSSTCSSIALFLLLDFATKNSCKAEMLIL